jgi:aminopeptidase N
MKYLCLLTLLIALTIPLAGTWASQPVPLQGPPEVPYPVWHDKPYALFPERWEPRQLGREDDEIDVLAYDTDLGFDFSAQTIEATEILTIESLVDDLTEVDLDLVDLTVDYVLCDGNTVAFAHAGDTLTIYLDEPFNTGEVFSLEIGYHGHPGHESWGGFFFTYGIYGAKIVFTVGDGLYTDPPTMARYWFPSHDVPYDKATSEMKVTAPLGWKVASNGLLVGVDTLVTEATWHWSETHQIATYLISMAACEDYTTFSHYYHPTPTDSMEVIFFVYPGDLAKAQIDFQNVVDMIDFFSSTYYPYPFDKYGIAEVVLSGAMEHQTMTAYGQSLITGNQYYEWITANELSHMWWGDMVTLGDWRDMWLNEGFASYFDPLYTEYKYGWAAFQSRMASYRNSYFIEDQWMRFPVYDPYYMWGATVYDKGAWVLHMLRYVVGHETFVDIMYTWGDTYAYGAAVTPDFQGVCEQVSGLDLDWFFTQWIYEAGYPEYEYSWYEAPLPNAKHMVGVHIDQVQQNAPVFTMPLEITIETTGGDVTERVDIESASVDWNTMVPDLPTGVLIDQDNWVLKKSFSVSAPVVGIATAPKGGPIQIPSSGGSFEYRAVVTNTTASGQDFKAWTDVTLPGGSTYGPVVGPVTLHLNPHQTLVVARSEHVPGPAPAGLYEYNAYVADLNMNVIDQSSFPFEKLP